MPATTAPSPPAADPGDPVFDDNEAACRVCGCTENQACPGGCWWVADPEMRDLCSSCAAALGITA